METLQTFLTQYSGFEAYAIFTLLVTASSIGLFNSDVTFITAGALSAVGFFDYRLLIVLGFFAVLLGDSITFFAARRWGRALVRMKPFSFVLNDEKMDAAESFFKRKGEPVIFFVRFLPLLRTSLFITVGSLKANPKKFYLFNALSTAIYVPLVVIGCNRASAHASEIVATLKKFQFIPILVLVSLIVFFYLKKSRANKEGAA